MKKFICLILALVLCVSVTACGSSHTVADKNLPPSFAIDSLWQPYEDAFEELGISEEDVWWDETGYGAVVNDPVNVFGYDMQLIFFTDAPLSQPCEYNLVYEKEISKEEAEEVITELYTAMVDEYGKPYDSGIVRTLTAELKNIASINGEIVSDWWKVGNFYLKCTYRYESETAFIQIRVTEK